MITFRKYVTDVFYNGDNSNIIFNNNNNNNASNLIIKTSFVKFLLV
jgi:hypothetical protein